MPFAHIESLAGVIRTAISPEDAILNVFSRVASAAYRSNAREFLDGWASSPGISGEAAALALLTAASARRDAIASESVEVVWTGPASHEVPVRRTREVLLELIGEANLRLIVVSFAAYRVPDVLNALKNASERGLDVRLILESSEESQGRLSRDAAQAFESLSNAARFFVWPAVLRSSLGGLVGALHAKAVIADNTSALVTSANLTGHAMTANMELGLLIKGGQIPTRLGAHFDELVARGFLRQIS
jgi:phosphatidylserine/phosphatidylglycerophosphate/cardiolipin synthase-like enzyme